MNNKLIILLFIVLTLVSCKKVYEDSFEYRILDKKICAIKNEAFKTANKINWLFPEFRHSNGEVLSGNLKIDKSITEYLFCSDLDEFKKQIGNGLIQSDIAIEIDSNASVHEYKLRNYSCFASNKIILNISKKDLSKICIE